MNRGSSILEICFRFPREKNLTHVWHQTSKMLKILKIVSWTKMSLENCFLLRISMPSRIRKTITNSPFKKKKKEEKGIPIQSRNGQYRKLILLRNASRISNNQQHPTYRTLFPIGGLNIIDSARLSSMSSVRFVASIKAVIN